MRCTANPLNLLDIAAVQAQVAATAEEFGRIDVLINMPAGPPTTGSFPNRCGPAWTTPTW